MRGWPFGRKFAWMQGRTSRENINQYGTPVYKDRQLWVGRSRRTESLTAAPTLLFLNRCSIIPPITSVHPLFAMSTIIHTAAKSWGLDYTHDQAPNTADTVCVLTVACDHLHSFERRSITLTARILTSTRSPPRTKIGTLRV